MTEKPKEKLGLFKHEDGYKQLGKFYSAKEMDAWLEERDKKLADDLQVVIVFIQEEAVILRKKFDKEMADGKQPLGSEVAKLGRLEGRKATLELIEAALRGGKEK